MQTIEFPSLTDDVRNLPSQGAARNRQLHRLIDVHAAAEAAAALHGAATRKRSGVLATVLKSADAILGGDDAARDPLRDAVVSPAFLSLVADWVRELREVASTRPESGACTIATALELWSWSMNHLRAGDSASDAVDELAGALPSLLAARCLALDVATAGSELRRDLSHVYAAHASSLAGAACAELVFGYRRHLVWDAEGCAACFGGDNLDDLEAFMPGIASGARMSGDVVEADGSHTAKAGPCAQFNGVDSFMRLRHKLDGCLTGARMAKDRAASAIAGSAR